MRETGCEYGLCDEDSMCRYCAKGGRRLDSFDRKDLFARAIDAERDAANKTNRCVWLMIQNDKLEDELRALRSSAVQHELDFLRGQVDRLTRRAEEAEASRDLLRATKIDRVIQHAEVRRALYEGEG